ncbi:MAG TPA: CDGSH iron-sulfur domain-containing protein [Chthoniobacterales bacterium]|nr:CDGSH iron-sulfur domain-containing protein [Chthoniobacterales bacterium]
MSQAPIYLNSRLYNIFNALHISYIRNMVTIETIKNGPYIVKGEVELTDADGNKFPVEPRMALCRCGASTEKPFCDGTHSKIGFKAAEKAVPESKE